MRTARHWGQAEEETAKAAAAKAAGAAMAVMAVMAGAVEGADQEDLAAEVDL